MGRCSGIRLEKAPDETAIRTFRHLLERHGLGKVLFETIKEHLAAEGLLLQEGTMMAASISRRLHRGSTGEENVTLRCSSPRRGSSGAAA